MALLKLNRHLYFLNCDSIEIKKVSNGRWEVTYDGDRTFVVVGGKEAGGSVREWWVHHPLFYGEQYLPTTSKIAAIRLGVQY
jgi:hypothetical protein